MSIKHTHSKVRWGSHFFRSSMALFLTVCLQLHHSASFVLCTNPLELSNHVKKKESCRLQTAPQPITTPCQENFYLKNKNRNYHMVSHPKNNSIEGYNGMWQHLIGNQDNLYLKIISKFIF